MSFDSTYFLYNMGSLLIAWLSIPVLALVTLYLRCFSYCFTKNKRLKRLIRKLENQTFWNYPIRVFNESASIIYMCCLINLQHPTFTTNGDKISTSMAICFLFIATTLPIVFTLIMIKQSGRLDDPTVKEKYGEIYEGLNLKRGKKLAIQPLFFFMRRLLLAIAVCQN